MMIIQKWVQKYTVQKNAIASKDAADVYESYFHTISASLLIIKAFPELKDIVRIELRKNQDNITNTIKKILEEKEKHI